MKLYIFPPSARALGIMALKNYLSLDCEVQPIDLRRGDQLTPQYLALNPNKKMPALEDDGFVLWESNAILFYMSAKHPNSGLWPSNNQGDRAARLAVIPAGESPASRRVQSLL
jgi:glutathione S-transferase